MKATICMRLVVTTFVAVLAIALQPSAQSQTYTTIDPAGSTGTSPLSINPAGAITGSYNTGSFIDGDLRFHGFLRAVDGTITPFDAPGAGTGMFQGTSPAVITPQGLIVGTYTDANFNSHIFLRAKDGTLTTLELPITLGAVGFGLAANSEGAIAGGLVDFNGVPHGFLRAPSGDITMFDYPAAFQTSFFAPFVNGISAGGTIVGNYADSNLEFHGFLRTVDGTITSFDVPNAAPGFFGGTSPTSINDSGTVTGFYFDTTQNGALRVFLRASNGAYSSFTPQTGFVFGGGASINPSGAVAGWLQDIVCDPNSCSNMSISFLRNAKGIVSALSDPEAVNGTQAVSINPAGQIIGTYFDSNFVSHGFLRKP